MSAPSPSPFEGLLQKGDLLQALALLHQELQASEPDPGRLLMIFSLEVRLHRFADAQATLRHVIELAPQAAAGLASYGRCARAEEARLARLTSPEVAGQRAALLPPPPHLLSYSTAAVQHAQGHHAVAAAALEQANAQRPRVSGTFTWTSGRTQRFVDLLDMDALTGAVLPCFGGDALLDLPYCQLRSVTFMRGPSSFDALWVPAEIVLVDGQLVHVRVPALYVGTGVAEFASARMGQSTLFFHDKGYCVGLGQRDLELHGEGGERTMVGILAAAKIDFDAPASLEPS
ncbi:MAG: hypothetical protein IPI49_21315 [Myxococcales bacterium]|nr:hypothetical protein [Myxococcales bacterium]